MAEHDNDAPQAPDKKPPKELVGVRLDPDIVARLEALRPRLSPRWRSFTRSDVIRMIVVDALPAFEDDADEIRQDLEKAGRPNGMGD